MDWIKFDRAGKLLKAYGNIDESYNTMKGGRCFYN
jgi:hypothetical protein